MLVVKGYIATKADADGKETANGTVLLERGKKKATWRKAWAVHVNFSNVIPEVSQSQCALPFRNLTSLLVARPIWHDCSASGRDVSHVQYRTRGHSSGRRI